MPDQVKKPPSPKELNEEKAARELGMISELRSLEAFRWFTEECLTKPYVASFDAIRNPGTEDLKAAQIEYLARRDVSSALLRKEIAWREYMNKGDSELPRLRAQLAAM